MGVIWRSCMYLTLSKIIKMQLKKLFTYINILIAILMIASCDPQKRIAKDYNYFQKGTDSIKRLDFVEWLGES